MIETAKSKQTKDWLYVLNLLIQCDDCNHINRVSFTKQLSKNLGLSSFLNEKCTLIPYHKILSLNLRYFMKLAPGIQV